MVGAVGRRSFSIFSLSLVEAGAIFGPIKPSSISAFHLFSGLEPES